MTGGTFAALLAAGAVALSAGVPAGPPSARLEVVPGPSYRVAVVVEAGGEPASGTYSLAVERDGAAGRARSRQGGAFDLEAGQRDTLSVSAVNAGPGDAVTAELVVEWAGGASTTDSFERVVE